MPRKKLKISNSKGQTTIASFFSKSHKLAKNETASKIGGGDGSDGKVDSDCEIILDTPDRSIKRKTKDEDEDDNSDLIPPTPQVQRTFQSIKRTKVRPKRHKRTILAERNTEPSRKCSKPVLKEDDEVLYRSPDIFKAQHDILSNLNSLSAKRLKNVVISDTPEVRRTTSILDMHNSKTPCSDIVTNSPVLLGNSSETIPRNKIAVKISNISADPSRAVIKPVKSTLKLNFLKCNKTEVKVNSVKSSTLKIESDTSENILESYLVDQKKTVDLETSSPDIGIAHSEFLNKKSPSSLDSSPFINSRITDCQESRTPRSGNDGSDSCVVAEESGSLGKHDGTSTECSGLQRFEQEIAVHSGKESTPIDNTSVELLVDGQSENMSVVLESAEVHREVEEVANVSEISLKLPTQVESVNTALETKNNSELSEETSIVIIEESSSAVCGTLAKAQHLSNTTDGIEKQCSELQKSVEIYEEPILMTTAIEPKSTAPTKSIEESEVPLSSESSRKSEEHVMDGDKIQSVSFMSKPDNMEVTPSPLDPKSECKDDILKSSSSSAQRDSMDNQEDLALLDDWDLSTVSEVPELCLDEWQRCQVVTVTPNSGGQGTLLQVRALDSGSSTNCLLRGIWSRSPVIEGDTVSLRAVRSTCGQWQVDDSNGLLVHHPDTLVSGTAVVGSLFCQRRAVLSDWFRGLDGGSKIMVIGSLVHELLQEVLRQQLYTVVGIRSVVDMLLCSPDSIHMLFSSSMSMAEARNELLGFVPHIKRFVDTYVQGNGNGAGEDNWRGSICAVQDIEESVWSPRLGIKGKVDVTVQVQIHQRKKVMPLELKTGRSSFSAEHRGQVILYTMMMEDLGREVDSGLLLYLRDGSLREVGVGHPERRDLLLLRNELAHHLALPVVPPDLEGVFKPPHLPKPINHHSACQKCPYLTLCSGYLRQDGLDRLSADHPLTPLAGSATSHLSQQHLDYLVRWGALLRLEEGERASHSTLKDIWSVSPELRERRGKSLAGLTLASTVNGTPGTGFTHVLSREGPSLDTASLGLSFGDMVLVSTDTRPALASGTVLDIFDSSLMLLLNRDLSGSCASGDRLHIDLYESQGMLSHLMTSLGALMEDTSGARRLRALVVDLERPVFERLDSKVLQDGQDLLSALNVTQQRAVLKALATQDYLLIKGMPGTGKTATITSLVQLLLRQGLSVLVASHTHSAVDNVLLRLLEKGLDFLRLGSTTRLHERLREKGDAALIAQCNSPEELSAAYLGKALVGTTCLGASHALFSQRSFDVCIVDESTQVLQPAALLPLFRATRFVLVGDPDQLPPVVRSRKASQLGLSESLFVRLDRPDATVCLDLQYRMNEPITDLANGLTYGGQLKCANASVAEATLELPHRENIGELPVWLSRALSCHLEDSVLFLDTGLAPQGKAKNCSNAGEGAVVARLLEVFMQAGLVSERVGVICPYRAQVALMRRLVRAVEVSTVDQFQGRDKDLVILSCTRGRTRGHQETQDSEILNDKRRLTVAITRAKYKLLLVGDAVALRAFAPFEQLFICLPQDKVVCLSDASSGFRWDALTIG